MKTKQKKLLLVLSLLAILSLLVAACATAQPTPEGEPAEVVEEEPAEVVEEETEAAAEEEPTEVAEEETEAAAEEEPAEVAEEDAEVAAEEGDFQLAEDIAERAAAGETPRIVVSYHDVSNEFAPFIREGVEQAAEELGVDATMVGPVGAEAETQIAELESLIERGVDGLAISSASTDALAPVIDRALAQGIPVVTFNTDNPASNRLAFVGQDLRESGFQAGELLAEKMGEEGNVIITTLDAAAQWSIDREAGARDALAQYPGINVLTTVNTGTEPQEIFAAIENAMQANPDVDGILSLECCSTPAAGEYVQRNNLTDEVTVVGFDLLPQTLQLIQDGAIAATIGQAPERQGYEAVKLLVSAVGGDPVSDIDTGIEVVDQSNIDQYLE